MNALQTIVTILGGQAILLAIGAWLARSFMSQVLAKELEKFKSELTRETALSVERFKHDLQVRANQKQTAFARIHEVRMEAVAKIYASLLSLSDAASALTQDDVRANSDEWRYRYEVARTAMETFRSDIRTLKLYLPRSAAEQVTAIADKIESLLVAVAADISLPRSGSHWHRFDTQLRSMMPIAMTILENEFQALLGIERDA